MWCKTICIIFFLIGYSTILFGNQAPDFVGTWNYAGKYNEKVDITENSLRGILSGALNGEVEFIILAFDTTKKQAKLFCESVTGNYSYKKDTIYFFTYSINEDGGYFWVSPQDYPEKALLGPYVKQ